eukprot:comp20626_c0_seq1/m.26673 comp20626_c0_seq1/g.26673  ORF comp20626_c0_seq1/g.26673 comp20626_c0_seq1/m.26673 type:complete len:520 (-) comp20626_c0_seq1:126-1685(-)
MEGFIATNCVTTPTAAVQALKPDQLNPTFSTPRHPPPPRPHHLLHPRDQIVRYMSRLYQEKLTTLSGGNISVCDREGAVWMTPGGTDKGSLKREHVAWSRDFGVTWEGPLKPSMEVGLHLAVYREMKGCGAVIHAHAPALVAFAAAGKLPPTSHLYQCHSVCGPITLAPYAIPGSQTLANSVADACRAGYTCVLLANHGAVVGGCDIERAFDAFETLETCARMLLRAMSLGPIPSPSKLLPSSEIKGVLTNGNTGLGLSTITERPHWWSDEAWQRFFIENNEGDVHVGWVESMTSEEKEHRQAMHEFVQRGYRQKLFSTLSGAVSVRLDKNHALVTPTAIDRSALGVADMVKVAFVDGTSCELGQAACDPTGLQPSHAVGLHTAIYQSFADVKAVVTAHPINVGALCVAHRVVDPNILPETYVVVGSTIAALPLDQGHNPAAVVHALSREQADGTRQSQAVIVWNEGVTVVGSSMLQVFDRLEVLEATAKAMIDAAPLGGTQALSANELAALDAKFGKK